MKLKGAVWQVLSCKQTWEGFNSYDKCQWWRLTWTQHMHTFQRGATQDLMQIEEKGKKKKRLSVHQLLLIYKQPSKSGWASVVIILIFQNFVTQKRFFRVSSLLFIIIAAVPTSAKGWWLQSNIHQVAALQQRKSPNFLGWSSFVT